MNIVQVTAAAEWDGWLNTNSVHVPFTQSFAWGEVLKNEGKQVERLAIVESGKWVAIAQVVVGQLPFGWQYAFCPKGPVFKNAAASKEVFAALASYFKTKGYIFLRIEPAVAVSFKKVIDVNPRATTIVDLQKTELELLAAMHPKTRYNINLASKKGVQIKEGKNWDAFWPLMQATGKRDGFRLHYEQHYRAIFDSPLSLQLAAWVGETPVAVMIAVGFGDTFTYVFGASDYEHRALMAPQLLQWEAIKLAKQRGYHWYDFFGIAPTKIVNNEFFYDQKHQYAGVTRFKLGFGGTTSEQPGTFDLLLHSGKYTVYQLLRRLRRMV